MSLNDKITTLISDPTNTFTPTWDNRKAIIKLALYFCLVALSVMTLLVCFLMVFEVALDLKDVGPMVTSIFTTVFITIAGSAMTIIGMYVFGVNFDISNYRSNAVNIMSNLITPRNESTATSTTSSSSRTDSVETKIETKPETNPTN